MGSVLVFRLVSDIIDRFFCSDRMSRTLLVRAYTSEEMREGLWVTVC
jgi:hypothetical protein